MISSTWSPTEHRLAAALFDGTVVDLLDADDKDIRAQVIRDLLLGREAEASLTARTPDPRGLRVRGARVVGYLDLDHLQQPNVPVALIACTFTAPVSCRYATLSSLCLAESSFDSGSNFCLDAAGGRVLHDLDLRNAKFETRSDKASAVRLASAHVVGTLDLTGAVLTNASGVALQADGLSVGGDAFLAVKEAAGSGKAGAIRLSRARIGGHLDLTGALITNGSGPGLHADGLIVDQTAVLRKTQVSGDSDLGAVRLLGAHVGAEFDLRGAVFINGSGPALHADGLKVGQNGFLAVEKAMGSGARSAVRLSGAQFGGQMNLTGAVFTNDSGPALNADGLTVGETAYFTAMQATGSGELGAVRLLSAHIGGQLDLRDVVLGNNSGPALMADGMTVDADAFMEMQITSSGEQGTVSLAGARVGGRIVGTIRSEPDLVGTRWLDVEGLIYRGVPDVGARQWLSLIGGATVSYAAQPYRQLASAVAAEGHDADVRHILIAQRRDQLARATPRRRDRAWGQFTWVTLGYGYRAWLALLWLLLVAIAAAALTSVAGSHGLYPKDHQYDGQRCSLSERVVLGVDNALPLVTTTAASSCLTRPAPNFSAQVVTWSGVGAQVAGWAFATLFVAGFTSAVRKT